MTQQPTPTITENDIDRIIRRDYPEDQCSIVMEVLSKYGKEKYHGGQSAQNRVRMAVLKLSAGDIVKLKQYMNIAIGDYRDVLAPAEYPNYIKDKNIQNSTPERQKAIIDKDWKQYCDWLNSQCPFKEGDMVIYRPSNDGRGKIIMTKLAALEPGKKYKIVRIEKGVYLVVEGFENVAGGGLYWSEFSAE